MFEQINKVLTRHIESGHLPYDIHEGSEHHLMSLFEAIRVQRNEAVHPTVGQVTPATVRLTISAFPSACRKVYDLIDWCQVVPKQPNAPGPRMICAITNPPLLLRIRSAECPEIGLRRDS